MKVDRGRNKKPVSVLPPACQELIDKLLHSNDQELIAELKKVENWSFGKCELYHWIEVLDKLDDSLSKGSSYPEGIGEGEHKKILSLCYGLKDESLRVDMLAVLKFTALLIEHSYARHVYNSVDHLLTMLQSANMEILLAVLNVIYVFAKRSNFLSRLYARLKSTLSSSLEFLGKSWGGKANGFGLAECCKFRELEHFPTSATSVVFEYTLQNDGNSDMLTTPARELQLHEVHKIPGSLEEIFTQLVRNYQIPLHQQLSLLFRLRTARYFADYNMRLKCIEARLQSIAIAILISTSTTSSYLSSPSEAVENFLYPGLIEELIDVLELQGPHLMAIKAACLRALTAIVHLEKNPRLNEIVECTGAYAYHGFVPTLVRECITSVIKMDGKFSQSFATSLFSFLYHLSSYQFSAESLVSAGVVECLLDVIDWEAPEPNSITFVTRAVRVLDLITNVDVTAFHSHSGWSKLMRKLEGESDLCRREIPFELPSEIHIQKEELMEVTNQSNGSTPSEESVAVRVLQCIPQRSALIKSILNFLRKLVTDSTFVEESRSIHSSPLIGALKHIFSNSQYYGATLFLAAMDLFTTIVHHSPTMLGNLNEKGLPAVIINSFVMKDIAQTSEVVCAVPTTLGALCINEEVRKKVITTRPFDRLLKTLVTPEYHQAMKKHTRSDRSTAATTLGSLMDQLLRHQPDLLPTFTEAILKLLDNLLKLGSGPELNKDNLEKASRVLDNQIDEEDIEDVASVFLGSTMGDLFGLEKEDELLAANTPPPQVEYIVNCVMFTMATLCAVRASKHALMFVEQGGLRKLYKIPAMSNLPIDFPTLQSCNTVASLYGALLSVTADVKVITEGLSEFSYAVDELTGQLDQLIVSANALEQDLPAMVKQVSSNHLLKSLSHIQSYLVIFNGMAKIMHSRFSSQAIPRHLQTLQIEAWGQDVGQQLLRKLIVLYRTVIRINCYLMSLMDLEKVKEHKEEEKMDISQDSKKEDSKEEPEKGSISKSLYGSGGLFSAYRRRARYRFFYEEDDEEEPREPSKPDAPEIKILRNATMYLTLCSRIGRSLSELFNSIVLLIAEPISRPRGRPPIPPPDMQEVVQISNVTIRLLLEYASEELPTLSRGIVPPEGTTHTDVFCSLTTCLYLLEFCELLMFDDNRSSYHLYLRPFENAGGVEIMREIFEHGMRSLTQCPISGPVEGIILDVLETWLCITEKLFNYDNLVKTSHTINVSRQDADEEDKLLNQAKDNYNALYLFIQCQRLLGPCLVELWRSPYLLHLKSKNTDLLLSCVRMLIESDDLIELGLRIQREERKKKAAAEKAKKEDPRKDLELDPFGIRQLLSMGFTRDEAEVALRHNENRLQDATDWLLASKNVQRANALREDEQMRLAIMLSLEDTKSKGEDDAELDSDVPQRCDTAVIDRLGDCLVDQILSFIFTYPESVFRVSSLMNNLCIRLGANWCQLLYADFVTKVLNAGCQRYWEHFEGLTAEEKYQKLRDPDFKSEMDRFGVVMHLTAQFAKEQPLVTVTMAGRWGFDNIVKVFGLTVGGIGLINRLSNMPSWVASMLVALDLCFKQLGIVRWTYPDGYRENVHWYWFDESSGKWSPYPEDNNRLLEKAFKKEDASCRVIISRRKYNVQFPSMMQVNSETNTCRPVLRLILPTSERRGNVLPRRIEGISEDLGEKVVKHCTSLLLGALEKDSLHALCRLLVRFTRLEKLAQVFVDEGGIPMLFRVRRRSNFKNFYTMATHIIRHIFEVGEMKKYVYESVLRNIVTSPNVINLKEVKPSGKNASEFHYLMKKMAAISMRDHECFLETLSAIYRFSVPFEKENYSSHKEINPLYVSVTEKRIVEAPSELSEAQRQIVELMTDNIVRRDLPRIGLDGENPKDLTEEEQKGARRIRIVSGWPPPEKKMDTVEVGQKAKEGATDKEGDGKGDKEGDGKGDKEGDGKGDKGKQAKGDTKDKDSSDSDDDTPRRDRKQEEIDEKNDAPEPWRKYELPLLTKSALTRLLMELVQSYPPVVRYIITCKKTVKLEKKNPSEEMTFLKFLLEYLLAGDMRISTFMGAKLPKRLLEAIVITENFRAEVHGAFVLEYKRALVRTFQLPECLTKHNRLRSFCSLINYFLESKDNKAIHMVIRQLIHKGVITDLARAPHYLDLDNSSFISTMNGILRPLDRLIKYVNQVNEAARHRRKIRPLPTAPVVTSDPSQESAVMATTSVLVATQSPPVQSSNDVLLSTSTPVVGGQVSEVEAAGSQDEQEVEPLVPLEVDDEDVKEHAEWTERETEERVISEMVEELLEGELAEGDETDDDDDDDDEHSHLDDDDEDLGDLDNYNSAGEEKESDYESHIVEDLNITEEVEGDRVREVMISFQDDTSSDHIHEMHEQEVILSEEESHSIEGKEVESEVEESGSEASEGVNELDVGSEEAKEEMESIEEIATPENDDDDDDEDEDEDDNDSSLLESDSDVDNGGRVTGRAGSSSGSSTSSRMHRTSHQPEETGPMALNHPLTVRRVVQVYSMATGRLVNQRSEQHGDGAERFKYQRIALQAGIMRPTYNPTTSVSQLMRQGERTENKDQDGSGGPMLMMEDYEMGPVQNELQRWDEEVAALDGCAQHLRLGEVFWTFTSKLQDKYELEKDNISPGGETSDIDMSLTVQPAQRLDQRNIEEASSVATRGSSPTQSVVTMETEASERSVSPVQSQGQIAQSDHTASVHAPVGSRESALARLAEMNPSDPLYTFFSAVAGTSPPPAAPPAAPSVSLAAPPPTPPTTSSPSDIVGPLLANTLTVSATSTATAQSQHQRDVTEGGADQQDDSPESGAQLESEHSAPVGTGELPEVLDQTFLAALPDNIRAEVLAQHQTELEQRQVSDQAASSTEQQRSGDSDIVSSLAPETQNEIRQQSEVSLQSDLTSFFGSLAPSLRRIVIRDLAERQELQFSDLPEEVSSEVQRERDRLRNLRENFPRVGLPSVTLRVHAAPLKPNWPKEYIPKQILDSEALTCILVLLFIEYQQQHQKLHVNRLHRVIRHVCVHPDTRAWVIDSLISILRMADGKEPLQSNQLSVGSEVVKQKDNWLNLTIAGVLGAHTQVFTVDRPVRGVPVIGVHPHACSMVCKNVLDLVVVLCKYFSSSFLPPKLAPPLKEPLMQVKTHQVNSNFWHILTRLNEGAIRKGKAVMKLGLSTDAEPSKPVEMFTSSFISRLIQLLEQPVIARSSELTDKVMSVLVQISGCIPKAGLSIKSSEEEIPAQDKGPAQINEQTAVTANSPVETMEIDEVFKKEEHSLVENHLLQYIMNVLLSSASLSDSCEENATKFLTNLSHCSQATRQAVMDLLIKGAQDVGRKVFHQIEALFKDVTDYIASSKEKDVPSSSKQTSASKAVLALPTTAPIKVDHSHDIHLPAMVPLTCKAAQQGLFLRILKVVHDLREAAYNAVKSRNRKENRTVVMELPSLSVQVELDALWDKLSECLNALSETEDSHAVLVLQSAVEAFFIVHALPVDHSASKRMLSVSSTHAMEELVLPGSPHPSISSPHPSGPQPKDSISQDMKKFLEFAENHRTVLNNILRQMAGNLGESPFAILINHTKLLDFDVKKRYFRQELDSLSDSPRKDDIMIHVRRSQVFEDSFRELYHRSSSEMMGNLYVSFEGEQGQDAGGILREWYLIVSREIFNPNYALFKVAPGGRTYSPNPSSHVNPDHLQFFKFVGRMIAKAIYDNKLLEAFFTRSFYKHILGKSLHFSDMEAEDYRFYQSMKYILDNNIDSLQLDLTFTTELTEFGTTKPQELKSGGSGITVIETNKREYVKLMCLMKMTESIKQQTKSFLEGFYEIIPRELISIFNEQELELLISGLPSIDLDDLKNNTEYHKYSKDDLQIQWLWSVLKTCDETDQARFLQFVTGTSRVPLLGFAALEGMSGPQKFQVHRDDRSTDRLPSAHTCFNQLDLPAYESYEKLKKMLLLAIRECPEGFGFV